MVAEYAGGQITRYRAEYFHQDHLGNTRLVFSDFNQNGIVDLEEDDPATPLNELEITQESHYYPFGMNHLGPWYETVAPENKYLYNGKELNGDYEINLMDYGARWYDGAIGRWTAVDPLAEAYYSWTPYQYVLGNPIKYFDPDGTSTHTDSLGNIIAVYNDDNLGVYKHNISANDYDGTELNVTDGKLMGATEYWNEFINPDDGSVFTNHVIAFGESWEPILQESFENAEGMDLIEVAQASGPGGKLDIKKDADNRNKGRLLNGKYATARSAGNYLAGFNAATHSVMGKIGVSFNAFQRMAGALHKEGKLNKFQLLRYYMGATAGPPPAYGELMYQYRMSKKGYEHGKRTTDGGRKKSRGF